MSLYKSCTFGEIKQGKQFMSGGLTYTKTTKSNIAVYDKYKVIEFSDDKTVYPMEKGELIEIMTVPYTLDTIVASDVIGKIIKLPNSKKEYVVKSVHSDGVEVYELRDNRISALISFRELHNFIDGSGQSIGYDGSLLMNVKVYFDTKYPNCSCEKEDITYGC